MASKISQLTAADALDGSEHVWVEQGGFPKRTTTQGIANLASGTGSQTPWTSDIDGGGFGLDNIDRLEIQAPGIATDTATFTHDGTDFNTAFANTTDWNITGVKTLMQKDGGHTTGTVSHTNAVLDLYNPLQADTDEKGSIITFSDNYFSGTYNKTTRAAIKGGTDTTGNTANGFLAFYTDDGAANSATERMRINYLGNVSMTGALAVTGQVSTPTGFLATPNTTSDTWGLRLESSNATSNDSGFWSSTNRWRVLLRDAAGNLRVNLDPGATSYVYDGFDVRGGSTLQVTDSGGTDYVTFAHDGTYFNINAVNTDAVRLQESLWIYGAGPNQFRIYDAGSTDYASFSHDGTDFNTVFGNTTEWNIGTGLNITGNITISGTVDGKDVSTLLANVVEDTTPQLGGNLDMNGKYITSTNHGRVGMSLWGSASTTAADWSNEPNGTHQMVRNTVTTAAGAPVNNYGYFTKVSQRDASGGWGGLWVGYAAGENYVGRTSTSASFATWEKLWTDTDFSQPLELTGGTVTGEVTFQPSSGENTISIRPAAAGNNSQIWFKDESGNNRWAVSRQNTTAGGDFRISRYNSSGVFQENPLLIDGATGDITLSRDLAFDTTSRTVAGIQNQNLVDKVADEVITGEWRFDHSVSDLNAVVNGDGTVFFKGSFQATNRPGTGNYATGVEFRFDDSNAGAQLAFGSNTDTYPNLYGRFDSWTAGEDWGAWVRFWHSQDFSQPLELTGGTMTGLLTTVASATGGAGFRVPHGSAPTTPTNGDVWTTTAGLFAHINGVTKGPYVDTTGGGGTVTSSGSPLDNEVAVFTSGTDIDSDATFTWNGTTMFATNVTGTNIGGIAQANLVDKDAAETISGIWDYTAMPQMRFGFGGDYSTVGGSTSYGATIWSLDEAWKGGTAGADSSSATVYGLRYIRSAHTSANANIGEGVYVYGNGNLRGGIGTNGIYSGAAIVAAGNISGGNVTTGSDPGHTHTAYLSLASGGTVAGAVTFTASAGPTISSTQPDLFIDDTDAAADEKSTIIRQNSGIFRISSATDAAKTTPVNDVFYANRAGTTWDQCTLTATTIDLTGNVDISNGLDVTGNITVTGTVDGLDLITDVLRANAADTFSGDLTSSGADIFMADNTIDQAVLQDYGITNQSVSVSDANITLSYVNGPSFEIDLENWSTNRTIFLPNDAPASGTYGEVIIKVQQDTQGSRTISWSRNGGSSTNVKWVNGVQPTTTSTADAIDIYHFSTWDGGTNWWGSAMQDVK